MTASTQKKENFTNGVVLFLDILGWKNLSTDFSKAKPISTIPKLTIDYLMGILKNSELKTAEIDSLIDRIETYFFSDTIVFIVKGDWESVDDVFNDLFGLLHSMSYLQTTFIGNKVLVRGAITFGEIYSNVEDNVIFGPALNKAYELESQTAIYPRIILDPYIYRKICKKLENQAENLENKINHEIINNFKADYDGYVFWDYLKNSLGRSLRSKQKDKLPDDVKDLYFIHRDLITENLKINLIEGDNKDSSSNLKVFQKYNWLLNYHNDFVNTYLIESSLEATNGFYNKVKEKVNLDFNVNDLIINVV